MENTQNNRNQDTQSRNNATAQSGMQGTAGNSQNRNMQGGSASPSGNTSGNQTTQGRSSQQGGTTGQGGMKNIQDRLQQFGSMAAQRVNGLSTTQKVIGGSLLALGAGWLAMGTKNQNKIKSQVSSMTSGGSKKKQNKKGA